MNIIAFISFLATLVSLLNVVIGDRVLWKLVVYSISFTISLIPTAIGLYHFVISPRSRLKRIKLSLMKYVYQDEFHERMDEMESRGKPLYCNPFTQESVKCNHFDCIKLKNDGEDAVVSFNHRPITCRVLTKFFMGPESMRIDGEEYEFQSTNSERTIGIFNCQNTQKLEKSLKSDLIKIVDFNVWFNNVEVNLNFNIAEGVLSCRLIKPSGLVMVELFQTEGLKVLEVIKMMQFMSDTKRWCCFILEGVAKVRSGYRLHSATLFKVIKHQLDGGDFYYTKPFEFTSEKYCEGEPPQQGIDLDMLRLKFGGKASRIIADYISLRINDSHKESCYNQLNKKNWYWTFKDKLGKVNNWKWKRIGCDLSYLLEKCNLCSLKNSDKTLSPTLKVQNFYKDHVRVNPSFLETENDVRPMNYLVVPPSSLRKVAPLGGKLVNELNREDDFYDHKISLKKKIKKGQREDLRISGNTVLSTSFYLDLRGRRKKNLEEFSKYKEERVKSINTLDPKIDKETLKGMIKKECKKNFGIFYDSLNSQGLIDQGLELNRLEAESCRKSEVWIRPKNISRFREKEIKISMVKIDNLFEILNSVDGRSHKEYEDLKSGRRIAASGTHKSMREVKMAKRKEKFRKNNTPGRFMKKLLNIIDYNKICIEYYCKVKQDKLRLRRKAEAKRLKRGQKSEAVDKGFEEKEAEIQRQKSLSLIRKNREEEYKAKEFRDNPELERRVIELKREMELSEHKERLRRMHENEEELAENIRIRVDSKGKLKYQFKGKNISLSKIKEILSEDEWVKFEERLADGVNNT